jgi:histone deacetylase complex regulatory component SIN3
VKERTLPKQVLSTVRLCDELVLAADSRAGRTSEASVERASKRRRYGGQHRNKSDEGDEAVGGSAWKRPQSNERETPSSSRAAQYIRDMKKQFKGQPGVHRQFFMILRKFKEKVIEVHQVMHAIADLFVHYERFLYGFDQVRLLPSPRCVLAACPINTSALRSPRGAIPSRSPPPLPPPPSIG